MFLFHDKTYSPFIIDLSLLHLVISRILKKFYCGETGLSLLKKKLLTRHFYKKGISLGYSTEPVNRYVLNTYKKRGPTFLFYILDISFEKKILGVAKKNEKSKILEFNFT